jgi:hypothetical protein
LCVVLRSVKIQSAQIVFTNYGLESVPLQAQGDAEVFKTEGGTRQLEQVADRLAIQEVLFLHSRGLDRFDAALLQSCYWPEAEVDYGSYKGPAAAFAELVVQALAGSYELTRHTLANTLIHVDGGYAYTESHVTARHLLQGGAEEMIFCGRYLDKLERRGQVWKMMHRQVVMDWSRREAVVDERESEAFVALARGGHTENDPSALHPGFES